MERRAVAMATGRGGTRWASLRRCHSASSSSFRCAGGSRIA